MLCSSDFVEYCFSVDQNIHCRVSKSTSNTRPRSNTTANPKCVRSLHYSPDRRIPIDKYVKSDDRVISVQYPFERTPQNLTNPVMKRIILKAYVRICHVRNDDRSLSGYFSCNNFIVSDPNEIVELCDVTTINLTRRPSSIWSRVRSAMNYHQPT